MKETKAIAESRSEPSPLAPPPPFLLFLTLWSLPRPSPGARNLVPRIQFSQPTISCALSNSSGLPPASCWRWPPRLPRPDSVFPGTPMPSRRRIAVPSWAGSIRLRSARDGFRTAPGRRARRSRGKHNTVLGGKNGSLLPRRGCRSGPADAVRWRQLERRAAVPQPRPDARLGDVTSELPGCEMATSAWRRRPARPQLVPPQYPFRVQTLNGQPVLTWWQGSSNNGSRAGRGHLRPELQADPQWSRPPTALPGRGTCTRLLVTPQGTVRHRIPDPWPGTH